MIWLVYTACNIYFILLLIRVVLSYFSFEYQNNPAARLLYRITEPILLPIRNYMRRYNTGPFDFSPMVAMFGIWVLQSILVSLLRLIGFH